MSACQMDNEVTIEMQMNRFSKFSRIPTADMSTPDYISKQP